MARIVPWSLPEIAGGSEGGYTPQPTPEPAIQYFDFSDVAITGNYAANCYNISVTGSAFDGDLNVAQCSGGALSLSGIEVINLVGVSQVAVKVDATYVNSAGATSVTSGMFSIDPITLAVTYLQLLSAHVTKPSSATWTRVSIYDSGNPAYTTSLVLTFYVYGSGGEIIQTEEVTLI